MGDRNDEGPLPTRPRGRPAAFFDLDMTLLTVNSGRLWVERERREGRLGLRSLAKAFLYLGLYRLGAIDMERAMSEALRTVRGLREDEVRAWTEEWWARDVAGFVAPGARPVLDAHRAEGHTLVLLTSSSPYASACAVRELGLDEGLSTVYEVADGRFTGRVVPPLCYGEGKVARAEALARARGLDLDASYFYTDSTTDLPMLLRVAHPRVVQPDPRLRREARRRGWPILDWSVPV